MFKARFSFNDDATTRGFVPPIFEKGGAGKREIR